MNAADLTGERFGRLTVIGRSGSDKHGNALWYCSCDCGGHAVSNSNNLKRGNTTSCGCFMRERQSISNITHGDSGTRLHRIWKAMHTRCCNPNFKYYKHYGGRGITICDEWQHSFENFRDWALSHGYTDDLTIDRIDVDGNYEPDNCRWVTMAEQNRNKRIFKKGTS